MKEHLLLRPSARFRCHGDGLCCTDIHQLGPVTRDEARALEAHEPGSTVRHRSLVLLRLVDAERGTECHFLTKEGRCRIHDGALLPRTCHRYPYGVARTPDGPRVTTDHRCPCRSMGERDPLDEAHARSAVTDRRGRLSSDRSVEGRIPLTKRSRIGWARYRAMEAELLEELTRASAARPVEAILGVEPFPAVEGWSWEHAGIELAQESRASRWGMAFRHFGRTLAWLACPTDERPPRLEFPPRLWAEAFDRAERRTAFDAAHGDDAIEAMYADFVADFIWGLEWVDAYSFTQLRSELVSRLAVARAFARALVLDGARPDRACAESIAMIEVVGLDLYWMELAATLPE